MGRNRTRRNPKSGSAHSSKWRIGYIRIGITAGISGIVTILCCVMWKSVDYTNAVAEIVMGIVSSGILFGIMCGLIKAAGKEKSKKKKYEYIYYVVLLGVAIAVIFIFLIAARGHWGEHEDRNQGENSAAGAMGDNTAVIDKDILTKLGGEKEIENFSWTDNIYIINIGDYFYVWKNKEEGQTILIENYIENYPGNAGNVVQKTDEELNQGDYGKYIAKANDYAHDVDACKMTDVKVYALDREIEQREYACKEYKKYDNLKILGDRYLSKNELCKLADTEKQEILEKALKNYIEALACAYNDSNASEDYISDIWDEIIKTYGALSLLETETLDESHKAQITDIIKACEYCKQCLHKENFG